MQNLFEHIEQILRSDRRFYAEDGVLLRNAVYEAAMRMDAGLIRLLLNDSQTKARFFTEVDGVQVFDKVAFGWVVNNRQFLPDSYTRFKNKIGLAGPEDQLISASDKVELVFPYKDCILEGGQTREDQKRGERFYNQTLAPDEIDRLLSPKAFMNAKRYTGKGVQEGVSFEDGDNLIIKGNNLLALSSLMRRFAGKIQCIYIDPPFNTGNDSFHYNDRFTRSTWLTFMKNRLCFARELLSRDGNIFIHIDINQSHYLKVLCDEIFGGGNFVEEIIWAYGSPSGGRAATPKPVNIHDYILHYCRDYDSRKQRRVYVPYTQKYIDDWFKYTDETGRIYQKRQRGKDDQGNAVWERQYLDESKGVPLSTVWTDLKQVYADPRAFKGNQSKHTELIRAFSGGQKPEAFIKRILELSTDEGDYVLDFHLGTGTTCAVAHKLNRRYIGIEQMNYIEPLVVHRLVDVLHGVETGISKQVGWKGGGSFLYCELATLNQQFVDRIATAPTRELPALLNELLETGYISSRVRTADIRSAEADFLALSGAEQRQFLLELLDKNLLYVSYCDMEDAEYAIPKQDQTFTRSFYEGD